MNTIETILSRRSVRHFTTEAVKDGDILKILKAGMSGPSAVNMRPWEFIVVKDKEKLNEMAEANGRVASPLKEAAFAVLVCGNLDNAYKNAPDYYIIDASIASENMIIAATSLNIGSLYLGVWPQEKKIKAQKELFKLPDNIIPHSIIAFGYASDTGDPAWTKCGFEKNKIHEEKW